MQAQVFIHGRLAAAFDANPKSAPRMEAGPALAFLSSQWTGAESLPQCQRWLRALLPANTLRDWWEAKARALARQQVGDFNLLKNPETILWAHPDAEWPGAISVASAPRPENPAPPRSLSQYDAIGDVGLAANVAAAERSGQPGAGGAMLPPQSPRVSLSGARPKTVASLDAHGTWRQAGPGELNTWIIKVEDSRRRPGEAGVESICQRALSLAGIKAAQTRAAILGDWQCVLSRREDRRLSPSGVVIPIHQEDFRQAAGVEDVHDAFELGPGWPQAYAIAQNHSADPDAECADLTRLLAASWLLGHGDLHRGNLGFHVSAPDNGPKRTALAPAYDVSSSCGTPFTRTMAHRVGGRFRFSEISAKQWAAHAKTCALDVDETLAAVSEVCQAIPGAFDQAVTLASTEDENREQGHVNRRTALIAEHIKDRADHFNRDLDRLAAAQHTPSP